MYYLRNKTIFYDELLTPRPTPKLEDHPLWARCKCLFNVFAATHHVGGLSSIHNLGTRHAVVTVTLACRGDSDQLIIEIRSHTSQY